MDSSNTIRSTNYLLLVCCIINGVDFMWEGDSLTISGQVPEIIRFDNIRGATPITASRDLNHVIQAFDPHTPEYSLGGRFDNNGKNVVVVLTVEGLWCTFDGEWWSFRGPENPSHVPPYVSDLGKVVAFAR